MQIESTFPDPRRLLPKTLEDRLLGLAGRAAGGFLCLLVTGAWLALLTWTVSDPSLTNATGGPTGNLLGGIGAIISDLMLQTLGFAAVVALLVPTFWGLELVVGERIGDFRTKACLYPVSVLALAGAGSSLPVSGGWPLHHGFGGILGDFIYGLSAGVLSAINPERAGAAAGLLFFAAGLAALTHSIGLSLGDLANSAEPDARHLSRLPAPATDGPRWMPIVARELFGRLRASRPEAGPGELHPGFSAANPDSERMTGWQSMPDPQAAGNEPMPTAGVRSTHLSYQNHAFPAQSHPAAQDAYMLDRSGHDPRLREAGWPAPRAGEEPGRDQGHGTAWGGQSHGYPQHQPEPGHHARRPEAAPPEATGRHEDHHRPVPPAALANASARREPMFDASTDQKSGDIARRFAPASTDVATPGKRIGGLLAGLGLGRRPPSYKRPSLNLLKRGSGARPGPEFTQAVLRGNARLLEDVLADFGIKGEVKDIRPGPIVTLYEVEPARGTKSARVIGLADDIARSMSVAAVRVAVVPGRNAIGIEMPNLRRETVQLREILESEPFRSTEPALPLALGRGIGGEPIVVDLARMPHLLVAGTTGSGKSVGVNAMILSLLYRHAPEDCRFLMIDPKMLELSVYNGIPHLLTPVVTDPMKAVAALAWAVGEMEERYKRMAQLGVRNIDVYNNRVRNAKKRGEMLARTVQTGFDARSGNAIYEKEELSTEPLPFIVIVVDEFADLMVQAGKEIEAHVQRLAQMARAAGIHLIMATQRPSVDIVTGTIKANFPTRIGFKVASKIDSRTILNETGAEQLLGQGDMLVSNGAGQIVRVHGAFVSDEEVESIAAALREQGQPDYVAALADEAPPRHGVGRNVALEW